jgi:hypothetical protein
MVKKTLVAKPPRRKRLLLAALIIMGAVGLGYIIVSSHAATADQADLNDDGVVNITDLSILLTNWGRTGSGQTGDIVADNVVNILDLSGLLSLWGATTSVASSPLPFNMPANATLKASSKKVFAHYFTPYPISIDNKDPSIDYYTEDYLDPNGENGKHAAYGGFLRERPLPQAPLSGSDWQLQNMKKEVQRAAQAGLDGFTVDILGIGTSYNWERFKLLAQAVPLVDPSFKLVIMPDGNGSGVAAGIDAFAAAIASVVNDPAYSQSFFRLGDGRLVISPFYPEKQGAAWWGSWLTKMKDTYGIDIAFVPCFLNYSASVDSFNSISYGFSNWGQRNPAQNANLANNINSAHSRGKIWMQPVSVQDTRPYDGIFDEANNTENLRLTWNSTITYGADWVQIPTWNDYSENAQIAPSSHIGWGPLDISSYYLTRFKTGSWPAIVRDVVYISHRVQPHAADPTGAQTLVMSLRSGSSPARDKVEVLSFLKSPATIDATIGGLTQSYSAAAGVQAQLFDLRTGQHSAVVKRDGTQVTAVTTDYDTTATRAVQDLNYYFVSSGRP